MAEGFLPPDRPRDPAPQGRYVAGVVITVLAVVSQYFVPSLVPASLVLYGNLPGDLFVVYGIPVLSFAVLVGGAPLRDWSKRMGTASWEGLRWYGLLSLLALVVVLALAIVYEFVDPAALQYLSRPNPALTQAAANPWFYVGLSFVVGAFEETIFRGWIFGYWRDRGGSWLVPAAWTSAIFAGVHLYYGFTYGPAAPLIFPTLFLLGFSFAATYRYSGGNLVLPALLHGENDASAYLTLINTEIGAIVHYAVILVGGLLGLIAYLRADGPARGAPG
ncbi:MAG TPA: CPBP family intramembrane glutamic endopeptidase [Thermoplasmata archaeon]|nr:CPBP family intramembrane glutamic endopeptidase [Thermoplasmata archaeon]